MDILARTKLKDAYDDIEIAIQNIKKDPKQEFILDLQNALNKFFDAKCLRVLYTNNTDKLFFGIYAMPKIDAEQVIKIITGGEKYVIQEYYLELDSKMFQDDINLSAHEIAALLMHEVYNLVSNAAPCEAVCKAIDSHLTKNNDILKISDSIHYMELLSYGFRDAVRKFITIFDKAEVDENEVMNDFFEWCGYKEHIHSAFDKIASNWYNYNKEINNKFIVLAWVLRVYRDVLHNRIPALMMIDRCKQLSPSKIEIKELDNIARRLNRIDDDALIESAGTPEHILYEEVKSSILPNKKMKSIPEALEDDIVKIAIEQENVLENEPDAVPMLMANINVKLAYIQDYVENNVLTKEEFKQLDRMYKELTIKRDQLFKGDLYDTRMKIYDEYETEAEQ